VTLNEPINRMKCTQARLLKELDATVEFWERLKNGGQSHDLRAKADIGVR
jgi:hypothetical protein